MPEKITVLLVDDHSLVRRGFRRMLEDEPDMEVAGEAGDGEEAVKLAKQLKPRSRVMDCALPHIVACKRLGKFWNRAGYADPDVEHA